MTEQQLADKLRKAYVTIISSGSQIFQAKHFDCLTYDQQDILDDAAKLLDVAGSIVLRLLEEKDLLLDVEPSA